MEGVRGVVAVALVSAAFGAGVTLLVTSSDHSPPEPERRAVQVAEPPESRPVERPAPSRRRGGAETPAGESDALTGLAPTDEERVWVREALVNERKRREDAIVKERERRENAVIRDTDGGVDILGRWLDSGADAKSVVTDYASMRARVRTGEGRTVRFEAAGEATPVKLEAVADDSAVIEFGPGRFVLDTGGRQWDAIGKVTKSLEIRGAGMDRTTLVARGWAFVFVDKEELRNAFIHDIALDFGDKSSAFDLRGRVSLALENVRLFNWQVAGHAAPLGVGAGAYLACRGCEFVGRGNGFGLSLRGPALAVLDSCRFSDLACTVIGGRNDRDGPPSVVRLANCSFENSNLVRGPEQQIELHVLGGRVAGGSASWDLDEVRKWWGAASAASLDGVTFVPGKARFTVADLLLAMDLAERAGIGPVIGVEVGQGLRASGIDVDFYTFDRAASKPARVSRRLLNGVLVEVPETRRGMRGLQIQSAADLDGLPALADLVRRAGIAAEESVAVVDVGREMDMGGSKTRHVMLSREGGSRPIVIDARTGTVVQR